VLLSNNPSEGQISGQAKSVTNTPGSGHQLQEPPLRYFAMIIGLRSDNTILAKGNLRRNLSLRASHKLASIWAAWLGRWPLNRGCFEARRSRREALWENVRWSKEPSAAI